MSEVANQSYCEQSFTEEKQTGSIHGEYILRFPKYQSTWLLRNARLKCKKTYIITLPVSIEIDEKYDSSNSAVIPCVDVGIGSAVVAW